MTCVCPWWLLECGPSLVTVLERVLHVYLVLCVGLCASGRLAVYAVPCLASVATCTAKLGTTSDMQLYPSGISGTVRIQSSHAEGVTILLKLVFLTECLFGGSTVQYYCGKACHPLFSFSHP